MERLHGTTILRDRLSASSYAVGSQLKYRCERGHVLQGGKRVVNRVCTVCGEWTGHSPVCKHVDCKMPKLVDNGQFRLQNNATAFGSMVFYECEVGWKLEGQLDVLCYLDGNLYCFMVVRNFENLASYFRNICVIFCLQ